MSGWNSCRGFNPWTSDICGCRRHKKPPQPPVAPRALVTGPLFLTNGIGALAVKVQNVGNTTANNVVVKLIDETECEPEVIACETVDIPAGCTEDVLFTDLGSPTIPNVEVAVCGPRGSSLRVSVTATTGPGEGDIRFVIPAASMLADLVGFCDNSDFPCPTD